MKTYRGERTIDGIKVTVDGKPLPLHDEVRRLSPNGFEWSFEGPEPAQLALAILVDHFGRPEPALEHYQAFMREMIAELGNEWELTGGEIDAALGRPQGG